MSTKLGKGFGQCPKTGKVVSIRHKLGSVSAQIKRRKSAGKPKVTSRARAAMVKGQRP